MGHRKFLSYWNVFQHYRRTRKVPVIKSLRARGLYRATFSEWSPDEAAEQVEAFLSEIGTEAATAINLERAQTLYDDLYDRLSIEDGKEIPKEMLNVQRQLILALCQARCKIVTYQIFLKLTRDSGLYCYGSP